MALNRNTWSLEVDYWFSILRVSSMPLFSLALFPHVIPIPKGHTKDLSNPLNYRGITILSNLSKVLEKLTLLWIHFEDSLLSLNPLQEEFRQSYGSIDKAYVLQQAIQSLQERGKKAYVAFFDGIKAFDMVWQAGLLIKLHQKGIKHHLC